MTQKPNALPSRAFTPWLLNVKWIEEQRESEIRETHHPVAEDHRNDRHDDKAGVQKAINLRIQVVSAE